jgi:hypothetical protein
VNVSRAGPGRAIRSGANRESEYVRAAAIVGVLGREDDEQPATSASAQLARRKRLICRQDHDR